MSNVCVRARRGEDTEIPEQPREDKDKGGVRQPWPRSTWSHLKLGGARKGSPLEPLKGVQPLPTL